MFCGNESCKGGTTPKLSALTIHQQFPAMASPLHINDPSTDEPTHKKSRSSAPFYFCTPQTLEATLKQYGVAVIPTVLTAAETEAMQVGAWQTMEHIGAHLSKPLKQSDPSTWRSFRELMPMHSMLMQHHGVGHAPFVWSLRQNPSVVATFASLWKCDPKDLITSFDGMAFHFPPEETGLGYFRNTWMHTDQSPLRNGFECIQSWVTAYDVNEGDATLSVIVGSHKFHHTLQKYKGGRDCKSDWFQLSKEDTLNFQEETKCQPLHIVCPAGSVVYWDSRTLHCGRESLKGRAKSNFRCVVYICMVPRKVVTKSKIMEKRIKAYKERRMTSHWPQQCKLFGKQPQTYGKPLPTVDPLPLPTLTALGRSLVGY